MKESAEVLLRLLRIALGNESDLSLPFFVNWKEVIDLSINQGVAAVAVDGVQRIYDAIDSAQTAPGSNGYEALESLDCLDMSAIKYEWFGYTLRNESCCEHNRQTISNLAALYRKWGVKMMIMKGYGLSLLYPIPSHRLLGDIDVYLFKLGGFADSVVCRELGIRPKQNEEKHSVFDYNGITIENHASFVNTISHPCYQEVELFLESEAQNASFDGDVYYPSPTMNAIFLPAHCGGHFFRGEASLRQLCDWACFLMRMGKEVDWPIVEKLSKKAGYFDFLCVMNRIAIDCFGVEPSYCPHWECSQKLMERVLDDIITPMPQRRSMLCKVIRFFSAQWKYNLVYSDNMFLFFCLHARAYLNRKNDKAPSLWDNQS